METGMFLKKVQIETQLEREMAEKAVQATLQTLAERITREEASDLAAQLPADLAASLRDPGPQQTYTLDDFLRKVAEREGCSREDALKHAQAVFQTLCEAVSHGEMKDVMSQLPKGFREAFACRLATKH